MYCVLVLDACVFVSTTHVCLLTKNQPMLVCAHVYVYVSANFADCLALNNSKSFVKLVY